MGVELAGTNASKIAAALLAERRKAGSPAMGMVLTLVVITDEGDHYHALRAARAVSREHPSRILGVIRRSARGAANLDAEVKIGEGGSGEQVLLRMCGDLAKHPESVVLPLLLPDSPVVCWWPGKAPDDPNADPLGSLSQRRITDTAALERGRSAAMFTQARNYADGNTDLSWTRLTPWRALLAAALDQYPARVKGGEVAAERANPSADLLVAWLTHRLKVPIDRVTSRGPGITSVSLMTGGGEINICRPDGRLAQFTIPNAPNRPVALKRRELAELLAEELRRLDPDDVYEATVKTLCKIGDHRGVRRTEAGKKAARRPERAPMVVGTDQTLADGRATQRSRRTTAARKQAAKAAPAPSRAKRTASKKQAAKKPATKRATKKSTAKRS
jgi:glucose-6-phosphate dehydrogenase assembly protein OpcA